MGECQKDVGAKLKGPLTGQIWEKVSFKMNNDSKE